MSCKEQEFQLCDVNESKTYIKLQRIGFHLLGSDYELSKKKAKALSDGTATCLHHSL